MPRIRDLKDQQLYQVERNVNYGVFTPLLNKTADRLICALIGRVLKATTQLGMRNYSRVLQIGNGLSVCEHPLDRDIDVSELTAQGLHLMAVRDHDGNVRQFEDQSIRSDDGGWLIAWGRDDDHDALALRNKREGDDSES